MKSTCCRMPSTDDRTGTGTGAMDGAGEDEEDEDDADDDDADDDEEEDEEEEDEIYEKFDAVGREISAMVADAVMVATPPCTRLLTAVTSCA